MKLEMLYNKESDSTEFILLEEVKFIYKGIEHTIPIGFKSDGCSCGRLLWGWCCALSAQYFKNYLIHDYRLFNAFCFSC